MDLSTISIKKVLLITFGVLIGLLILLNITRYISSLPGYIPNVYPTGVPESQSQHEDIFPTLKPSAVDQELEHILNNRADLSAVQKESIASLSGELILHPHRGTDFEIAYSPILNLFFVRLRGNSDDKTMIEYLKDPVMRRLYQENTAYRLFVFTKSSAEYSRSAFEQQYSQLINKAPTGSR